MSIQFYRCTNYIFYRAIPFIKQLKTVSGYILILIFFEYCTIFNNQAINLKLLQLVILCDLVQKFLQSNIWIDFLANQGL